MARKIVACVHMIMLQNNPQNIYTRKYLVMVETTISYFYTSFYIPAIQKLVFHILHVQILGTNHFGDSCKTTLKLRKSFQDVICRCDYAEKVVTSFSHQIKP